MSASMLSCLGARQLKNCLAFAGRNGPLCLVAGVLLGFAVPVLSDMAWPAFGPTVFVFTLGAFLKVDFESLSTELAHVGRNLVVILWAMFGVPLLVFAFLQTFELGPDLKQGLLLWALAPPSGAAAALAAILGLSAPLALLAGIAVTAASPLYMPLLAAALGGFQVAIDPLSMAARLFVIVGGACVTSIALRRMAATFIRENPDLITGVTVLALLINGMGAMHGMQARFLAEPITILSVLALGYVANLGFQVLGALLFWRSGKAEGLTVGLISGNRNSGLAWAAAGSSVLPLGEAYLAVCSVAIHTAPALTKKLIMRLMSSRDPTIEYLPMRLSRSVLSIVGLKSHQCSTLMKDFAQRGS